MSTHIFTIIQILSGYQLGTEPCSRSQRIWRTWCGLGCLGAHTGITGMFRPTHITCFRVSWRRLLKAERLAMSITDCGFSGEIRSSGRIRPASPTGGYLEGGSCPAGVREGLSISPPPWQLPTVLPPASLWSLGLALFSLESPPSRVSKG